MSWLQWTELYTSVTTNHQKYLLTVLNALLMVCIVYINKYELKSPKTTYKQLLYYDQNGNAIPSMTTVELKLTNQRMFELKEGAIYRQLVATASYRPIRNFAGVNCTKIVNNNQNEIKQSEWIMRNSKPGRPILTAAFYLNVTQDCRWFLDSRGYIEHPLSKTEYEFPLAFSILVYKEIEQVERLLRLIYRPHNFYCIHIDLKMNEWEKRAIRKIANCLSHVFIANTSINEMSVIDAELECMRAMWPYKQWKYYINLAGQEFPLKTNREIVAILKELNGANVVDEPVKTAKTNYHRRWELAKGLPPHNITIVNGSMHIVANREFVDFCLHDQRALDLKKWLMNVQIPEDKTFFPSLKYNQHLRIPGSFLGESEQYHFKPSFLRFKIWEFQGHMHCYGKFERGVCVLGVGDIHGAYNSTKLFANKFHIDFDHIAFDCLEELLYEKTWKEYLEDV